MFLDRGYPRFFTCPFEFFHQNFKKFSLWLVFLHAHLNSGQQNFKKIKLWPCFSCARPFNHLEMAMSSKSASIPFFMEEEEQDPVVMSGDEMCIPRSAELLESLGLPGGLLPLKNIEECGFDRRTGLVWIKQKKKSQHYFKRAGRLVSFDEEVRAYVEDKRLKNVSGVKAKEYLVWAPVGDITVEGPDDETLRFKSYGGISRTFPAKAFSRKE